MCVLYSLGGWATTRAARTYIFTEPRVGYRMPKAESKEQKERDEGERQGQCRPEAP